MSRARKSDAEIQREVLQELAWDTRVEETEVGVQVRDGIVTLTGSVSSWAKRLAAQEAAHRVRGVLDVANEIEVRPAGALARADTEIAQAVRQALEWDVFVPDTRIQSTVSDGTVTLEGSVDTASERDDAERAVRNLAGVRRVINKIGVAPSVTVPGEVRAAIAAALARRAHREAQGIRVEVDAGGRVTLSGRVRSWADKEAAVGAARYVPGVRVVDDRLEIEPHESHE